MPSSIYTFGINPMIIDTYIRSCGKYKRLCLEDYNGSTLFISSHLLLILAGYSVITYLLGIGDRHLDNLLLSPSGNLFHVDFAYILGKDPKPFPPVMKLCREMVEAMGGLESEHYLKFKSYCFTAFSILRKSAHLILNLFELMHDATIPSMITDKDVAIIKVSRQENSSSFVKRCCCCLLEF